MTAQEKVTEAEYFLTRLPNLALNSLGFEVSAFLSATRSIFDHLLEDYRKKFQLGDIGWLDANTFEKRAEKTRNLEALRFIKWYGNEMDSIKTDHAFLFESRRQNIHFKRPKESFRVETRMSTSIPAGTTVEIPIAFPPLGHPTKVEGTMKETGSETTERVQAETTITAFFRDMPDKNLLVLCEGFLTRAKQLVQQAESLWGKP